MTNIRRWVCYDANGIITQRRNASTNVAAYGDDSVLEYDLSDIPGEQELIPELWRVNLDADPVLELRPAMPVTVEQLEANRISTSGTFIITFTVGASPLRCIIPGQNGYVDDADGVIEWETDEPGEYRFRFEHGMYLPYDQTIEAI